MIPLLIATAVIMILTVPAAPMAYQHWRERKQAEGERREREQQRLDGLAAAAQARDDAQRERERAAAHSAADEHRALVRQDPVGQLTPMAGNALVHKFARLFRERDLAVAERDLADAAVDAAQRQRDEVEAARPAFLSKPANVHALTIIAFVAPVMIGLNFFFNWLTFSATHGWVYAAGVAALMTGAIAVSALLVAQCVTKFASNLGKGDNATQYKRGVAALGSLAIFAFVLGFATLQAAHRSDEHSRAQISVAASEVTKQETLQANDDPAFSPTTLAAKKEALAAAQAAQSSAARTDQLITLVVAIGELITIEALVLSRAHLRPLAQAEAVLAMAKERRDDMARAVAESEMDLREAAQQTATDLHNYLVTNGVPRPETVIPQSVANARQLQDVVHQIIKAPQFDADGGSSDGSRGADGSGDDGSGDDGGQAPPSLPASDPGPLIPPGPSDDTAPPSPGWDPSDGIMLSQAQVAPGDPVPTDLPPAGPGTPRPQRPAATVPDLDDLDEM